MAAQRTELSQTLQGAVSSHIVFYPHAVAGMGGYTEALSPNYPLLFQSLIQCVMQVPN